MKVLVYGAAGSQQFPVIGALLKKGAEVYATTHTESNRKTLEDAGANVFLADMGDVVRLNEISRNVDAVALLVPFFLSDPASGFYFAKNAIDAAVNNGVQLLVWNASGLILPEKIGNPALDARIDILNYLRKSGLPYIVIQPSVYAENLLGPWTAPFVINQNKVAYPTPEEMPIGWIATQDVAALVAEAIFTPELANQSFQVSGLQNLTGNQLADKFSVGLGRNIGYYAMPPKEFGQILDSQYGPGSGKSAEAAYEEIAASKTFPVLFSDQMPTILQKLKVDLTPMDAWVRQHKHHFLN